MDWQDTRLVCRHLWLPHLLERHGGRHPPVCCGGNSVDWRYFGGADHPSRAIPLYGGPTCGACCSPDLDHQPILRGSAGDRLFHSLATEIRDVAGSSGERPVPRAFPPAVWYQRRVKRLCVWLDIWVCLLAVATTVAAYRRPFVDGYACAVLWQLSCCLFNLNRC